MTIPMEQLAPAPPPVPAWARPRPARWNFYWTLGGNVVSAACQWGMLSLIAKLGAKTMVGQFSLALAITTPVVLLSGAPRFIPGNSDAGTMLVAFRSLKPEERG